MPFELATIILPSGAKATRAELYGVIDKEDAGLMMQELLPGGAYFGQPLYVSCTRMGKMSLEARSIFSTPPDPNVREQWVSVCVNNPLARVTINFLLRVSGSKKVKLFSSESKAMAWLDERAREDAANESRSPA